MHRTLFLVSDHTGITVETLVGALLTQFDGLQLKKVVRPFVDTMEKVEAVLRQINNAADEDELPPLVFTSLVDRQARDLLKSGPGLLFDFFDMLLQPVAQALGQHPRQAAGLSHSMGEPLQYDARVEAMNFALSHDDGLKPGDLDDADVILLGVSRSGKTPTSLYLALHYGLRAANYPLTEEDFSRSGLPVVLQPHRDRLFGLLISANRLGRIRSLRRPNSDYASMARCRQELKAADALFNFYGIPWLDSTSASIEEIAAAIANQLDLQKSG